MKFLKTDIVFTDIVNTEGEGGREGGRERGRGRETESQRQRAESQRQRETLTVRQSEEAWERGDDYFFMGKHH